MTLFEKKNRLNDIAGIGTILIIFAMSLYALKRASGAYDDNLAMLYLGFAVYLACFVVTTRTNRLVSEFMLHALLMLQLLSTFFIMWHYPIEFLPILTIIWASILPFYFNLRISIIVMLLVVACWFSLYQYLWHVQMIFSALLYSTFHFFAILMTHHAREAQIATEKAILLNEELVTTQQLLTEATKQNERTRIARELHDLLGHHLTALIINLQVAEHLTIGEAKEKIEQCHSLAKLLMSDVREAVDSLRENNSLDFESLVKLLVNDLPRVKTHLKIDAKIGLEELQVAKTLLSCVQEASTNCLKHSNANEFWITLKKQDQAFVLELYDNGQAKVGFVEGNGLKGMRERLVPLNGELKTNIVQNAMQLLVKIPDQRNALVVG